MKITMGMKIVNLCSIRWPTKIILPNKLQKCSFLYKGWSNNAVSTKFQQQKIYFKGYEFLFHKLILQKLTQSLGENINKINVKKTVS